MKNRLVLLAAICAVAFSANAELLVYKGNMVEKRYGNGAQAKDAYRSLLIVDNVTGDARKINYYTSGTGFYMVGEEQQFLTNRVVLKDGRTQTVLARAQSGSPTEPVVSVFAKGLNSRLQVASNAASIAARTLDWNLKSVGPSQDGSESLEEAGVLVFHEAFTMSLNNQGKGLAEAEQSLRSYLEAHGYREVKIK